MYLGIVRRNDEARELFSERDRISSVAYRMCIVIPLRLWFLDSAIVHTIVEISLLRALLSHRARSTNIFSSHILPDASKDKPKLGHEIADLHLEPCLL